MFSLSYGFDGLFDTSVDEFVLHALLDQLDELLAHLVTSERLSDG